MPESRIADDPRTMMLMIIEMMMMMIEMMLMIIEMMMMNHH